MGFLCDFFILSEGLCFFLVQLRMRSDFYPYKEEINQNCTCIF